MINRLPSLHFASEFIPEFIMKQAAQHKAPENAFHDLSAHSFHFRQKIIKEFDLLDSVSDFGNISQPIFNTKDFSGIL